MKISKIKINNINFFNLFFSKEINHTHKIDNLKKILNSGKNLIFLGRARTGIYILTKYFLKRRNGKYSNVLIVPFTIPDIINLIKKAGGNPIFLDFDNYSTFVCLKDLKFKIKKYKPKILILTHYHLEEKNIKEIVKICKKNSITLIEDRAVSYGALKKNKVYGDAAVFSFSSFKLLNYYYGGALTCKKNKIHKDINFTINRWKRLSLLQHSRQVFLTLIYQFLTSKFIFNYLGYYFFNYNFFSKKKYGKFYFSKGNFDQSYFTRPSFGFFEEILNKITNIKINQEHRTKIFKIYYKNLKKYSVPNKIKNNQILSGSCYNFLMYHKNSLQIRRQLKKKKFDIGKILYENLNKSYYKSSRAYKTINLNNLSKNLIVLPTHKFVTEKYASDLAKEINRIINKI